MRFKELKRTAKRGGVLLLLLIALRGELPQPEAHLDILKLAQAGAPTYHFASQEPIRDDELAVTWGVEEHGDYVAIRYNLFLTQDRGIGGLRVTLADGTEVKLDEVAGVRLRGIDEHDGDVETLWTVWRRLGGAAVEEVGVVIKRHDDHVLYPAAKAADVVVSERKHAQFLGLAECLEAYRGGIGGIRISTEYCDDQGLVYEAVITPANRWDQASEWRAATGELAQVFELADRGEGRWCVRRQGSTSACRAMLAPLPADVWNEFLPAHLVSVSQ